MRIYNSSMNSVSTSSPFSPHSTISTHSLTSHSNSISSLHSISSSSSPIGSVTRCEGLDLLVKAVYYVAGSIVGVPFLQRRVIRRRRSAFEFKKVTESEIFNKEEEEEEEEGEKKNDEEVEENLKGKKRQRRDMALPLKYQDSVLQPWKPQNRQR